MADVRCYIDKYNKQETGLFYVLREKQTNRRVDLIFMQESEKSKFREFLRWNYEHADLNSGIRCNSGYQYVKVSGRILGGSDTLVMILPGGEGVPYYAVTE